MDRRVLKSGGTYRNFKIVSLGLKRLLPQRVLQKHKRWHIYFYFRTFPFTFLHPRRLCSVTAKTKAEPPIYMQIKV